jgi:hypothetical protein
MLLVVICSVPSTRTVAVGSYLKMGSFFRIFADVTATIVETIVAKMVGPIISVGLAEPADTLYAITLAQISCIEDVLDTLYYLQYLSWYLTPVTLP